MEATKAARRKALPRTSALSQRKTTPELVANPKAGGEGDTSPRSVLRTLRVAQILGLFPVTGLGSPKDSIEFRPCSLRLVGTICLLIVIVIMEGFSLINIFLLGRSQKDYLVSNEGLVIQYGLVMADIAPIIHYGTTVLGIASLLRLAWNFPDIAKHIGLSDPLSEDQSQGSAKVPAPPQILPTRRKTTTTPSLPFKSSSTSCFLIISLVMALSLTQAVFGTLVANLVLDEAARNASGNSVEKYLEDNFFSKYAVGSHSFLVTVMNESFLTGILAFFISNYTIFVWIILDLTLILISRSLSLLTEDLNAHPDQAHDIQAIRSHHWTLCRLIRDLGRHGINTLFLAFYIGNLYFLWIHSAALATHVQNTSAHPTGSSSPSLPSDSSTSFSVEQLYLTYQIWATCRQLLRLAMISHYAVKIASGLKQDTLENFVLSHSDRIPDGAGRSGNAAAASTASATLETVDEGRNSRPSLSLPLDGWMDRQRLKNQCLVRHNGFHIGCLFPLKRRSLVYILIFLSVSLLWTNSLESSHVLRTNQVLRKVFLQGDDDANSAPQIIRRHRNLNIVHW